MTTASWAVRSSLSGTGATMTGVKGRVLVVDDDIALAEMLGIVLRTEGFEPFFCSDGARALAVFRETKPDLVLLDLMLPGRDGIDVCRSIRAESGVPIVMLTAKTDTVDIVLGLESGADDYVVKPFKPKELVARVRTRLRRNRCRWALSASRRRVDPVDPAGVRSARCTGPQALAGVHSRDPAAGGLGLSPRRGHAPG